MSGRITIDFDLVDIEMARLSEALAKFQDLAKKLYDATEPVSMRENLRFGHLRKSDFTSTYSTRVFNSMESGFMNYYEKLFRGLRRKLNEDVLASLIYYYKMFAYAFGEMRKAESDNELGIKSKSTSIMLQNNNKKTSHADMLPKPNSAPPLPLSMHFRETPDKGGA